MTAVELSLIGPIRGRVRVPGSKSITNRALLCAALASGRSVLAGASLSLDSHLLLESLRRLGFAVRQDPAGLTVDGLGGRIPGIAGRFHLGNAGTAMRFLTAFLTVGRGEYGLDGTARMRERPIGDLVDALRRLGAKIEYEAAEGFPPLRISASGLAGGEAAVRGDTSSQFLSGLLLAAPKAKATVRLRVEGPLVSRPYAEMTVDVLRAFGAEVRLADDAYEVPGGQELAPCGRFEVEPDAASANYFLAMAAVTGGDVTVEGIGTATRQGEARFADLLQRMGCYVERTEATTRAVGGKLAGIDADCSALPDSAQTLAAVALFAKGRTTIRGVANLRVKETDRLAALAAELGKLGAKVEALPDGLAIDPPEAASAAAIEGYDDHRMVMSFAVAATAIPGIVLREPACVGKSFPDFFEKLRALGVQTRFVEG